MIFGIYLISKQKNKMKINILENCMKEYSKNNQLEKEFFPERTRIIKEMRFRVVTEGSCDELSMAVQWCLDNVGKRKDAIGENYNFRKLDENSPNGLWTELWYGKTGYDYGFSEFFFQNENDLNNFVLQIPNFYATDSNGDKWKTNGVDNETKVS